MCKIMRCASTSSDSDATPLPRKILFVLVLVCTFHDIDITMVLSFAPKMIKTFGTSEVNTGYYAGILGSSMYAGFLLCSLLWNYLGVNKSKKLSVIVSSSVLAFTILAFGFSTSFSWALVTRLLQGCSFGAVNVSKSILCEHLDDTNMALGMAIITSCGTIGLILGPSLSGFLVFPAEQYPNVFSKTSIFHKFPILLPNLVISLGLFISIIFSIIYLPGTKRMKPREYIILENRTTGKTWIAEAINLGSSTDSYSYEESDEEVDNSSSLSEAAVSTRKNRHVNTCCNTKILKVFKVKDCILSCILYGIFGFSAIAFNELFPLLASTSVEYDGMALSTSDIGAILMVVTAVLVLVQIPVLKKTTKLLGARKTFCYSAILQAILIPLLPAIGRIRDKTSLWILLCVHVFMLRLLVQASFLSVSLLINNTISSELNATANGIGFTFTAIGRFISPLIFGSLYSWSLTNMKGVGGNSKYAPGFPWNQFFAFFVWSLVSVIIASIATQVSRNADRKVDVNLQQNEDEM